MTLKELLWMSAVATYKEYGDPSQLIELLQNDDPIPACARELFVDILTGKHRKKGRGRCVKLLREDGEILFAYLIWTTKRYFILDGKSNDKTSTIETREALITRLATKYSRTEEAIRTLIRKQGTKDWSRSAKGKK